MTAGTPTRSSASSTSAASLFVGTRTATWRGRTGSRRSSKPSTARATRVAGDDRTRTTSAARSSAIRASAAGFDAYPLARQRNERIGAVQDAHAQRGGHGRVDQPRLAVRLRRADGPVDDAFVAELGAVEERVEGVDQPLVAAPVRRQRRLGDGAVGGAEVGVDVGSAEGVHRLLRVADEDQRRLSLAEGAPHDLPLDRVGVLELVDERNAVLLAQLRAGGGAVLLVGERVPEPGEQVVVGHDSAAPLARLDLRAHGFREPAPHCPRLRLVSRASLDRLEAGERVADRGSSDPEGLGPVERRPRDSVEAADVEVVDDLLDEIGQVLDERHVALDVAGDAESREHVLAEAVRGRDGGGVEARDGIGEPAPPQPPPRRRSRRQAARARGRPPAVPRRRARVRVPAPRSRAGRAPALAARRSPSA